MEIQRLNTPTQELLKSALKYPTIELIIIELLENSIKAHADYIEILLEKEKLSFKDNGIGINNEILIKIIKNQGEGGLYDLNQISDMKIVTKNSSECWKTEKNSFLPSKSLQKSGTVIILEQIYKNLPARFVFYSKNSIFSIISAIEPQIITNPYLRLKVFFESELIKTYEFSESIKARVKQMTEVECLSDVYYIGEYIEIKGYISDFTHCLLHKNYQFIYTKTQTYKNTKFEEISNRINILYTKALKILFPQTIEYKKPKYPVFVLFLSFCKGPNFAENMVFILKEVTIMLKEQIFTNCLLSSICEKYLCQTSLKRTKAEWVEPKTYFFLSEVDDSQVFYHKPIANNHKTQKKLNPSYDFRNFSTPCIKKSIFGILSNTLENFVNPKPSSSLNSFKLLCTNKEIIINKLIVFKTLGQIDHKFIIGVIDKNGEKILTAFDQHASDERIKLESLEKNLGNDLKYENCRILLKLNSFDREKLEKNRKKLEKFNFVIKNEENNTFLVRLPMLYNKKFSFSDFLSAVHDESLVPLPILNVLKYKACRSAVKFGEKLSLEKCENICKTLAQCVLFDKCAHGRPSFYPLISFPPRMELPLPNFKILK